jgi:predicted MFS family arabinose efflux permease
MTIMEAADDVTGPRITKTGSITLRAAFAISSTGDWIYKFAVPTLILRLTGSPVDTALAYVLEFIPYVVVGPFAGVIADRFPRRRIMVGCDAASCLIALVLAGLVQQGHTPIAALYACALALSCTRPLYFPAFQGFLVEMISDQDRPRFNAWTEVTGNLLDLAGPVLGISIVAVAGVPLATVLDAVSFAASAALVATIAYHHLAGTRGGNPGWAGGVLRDLAAGLRTVAISRAILAGTILLTLGNLAAFLIEGNLVYVLLHTEHYPKIVLGVVFSAQGLGGLIGAFAAPRLIARYRTGHLLAAGMATSAVGMAIQTITPQLPTIAPGQALECGGTALIVVCWFSTVQRLVPGPVIGRFVSVVRAIAYATLPAGALLGAWLLTLSAAIRPLFGCATAVQLAVLVATLRSPLIRIGQEDEPTPTVAEPSVTTGDVSS